MRPGRAERIEAAIQAARQVASTPGAIELSRKPRMRGDKHTRGTWSSEDEQRLRDRGEIVMPDGQIYTLRGAR